MRRMREPVIYYQSRKEQTFGDIFKELLGTTLDNNNLNVGEIANVYKLTFDAYNDYPYEGSSLVYVKSGKKVNFFMNLLYQSDNAPEILPVSNETLIDNNFIPNINLHGYRITLELVAINQEVFFDFS